MQKLIFKKLVIVFGIYFLLIGCTPPRVIITPNKLPDAVVEKPYYAEIKIDGGSGPIVSGFKRDIFPEQSGLKIIFPEVNGRAEYNYMIIQGTPKIKTDITVKLKGAMIPTGWNASSEFEKTYVIKVKEKE